MHLPHALRKKGLSLSLICSVFRVLISFDSMRTADGATVRYRLDIPPRSGALQAAQYEVVVLTAPAPLTDSVGQGVRTGQAVGTGRIPGSVYPDETHAVLWPQGSRVGVDLHPPDFRYSAAL